jgi:hypothetical protein
MGNHHTPVDIDPTVLKHSQQLWTNFTKAATFGVIASVIVLGLMAFFLVG